MGKPVRRGVLLSDDNSPAAPSEAFEEWGEHKSPEEQLVGLLSCIISTETEANPSHPKE